MVPLCVRAISRVIRTVDKIGSTTINKGCSTRNIAHYSKTIDFMYNWQDWV